MDNYLLLKLYAIAVVFVCYCYCILLPYDLPIAIYFFLGNTTVFIKIVYWTDVPVMHECSDNLTPN